ncbi:unnamed protein product [Owenia fusiformis]|uniref:Uncharacterized protein n=1 Tax=Owenia fusiformis TaxID=6347 RepID=A0A8J1UCZ4_OWEFU|nr:unnamed protein product [Owenia fusiformis]
MSGFSNDLSDEQTNALAIMREHLSDVSSNPLLDDDYLLRFLRGLLQCCQVKDLIWLNSYSVEKADVAVKAISKPYKGATFILDYRNLGMDMLSKPNLDLQYQLNSNDGIFANYYPEFVNKIILISNSTVMNILFKLYKAIAPKHTLSKIELVKDIKDLKRFIDEDQLIGYYGGTLVDQDGDPKFSSKITYPSKIPKSYYMAPSFADYELNSDYTKVDIERGQEITIEIEVNTIGFSIIWFVLSKEGELEIGINFKGESGEVETVEPMAEVHCHLCPESGSKICSKVGIYTVVIKNNALLKKKRVAYNVDVLKEDGHDVI